MSINESNVKVVSHIMTRQDGGQYHKTFVTLQVQKAVFIRELFIIIYKNCL